MLEQLNQVQKLTIGDDLAIFSTKIDKRNRRSCRMCPTDAHGSDTLKSLVRDRTTFKYTLCWVHTRFSSIDSESHRQKEECRQV